ncbi:CR1 protein, partial [Nothocercus nigrocapillus]|nr:CR1 protein [Nothocercus nigrocapillus]
VPTVCACVTSSQLLTFPFHIVLLCPSPPSIKNGQYNSRDGKVFIPGVSVYYHCDPGFTLTGTTKVSCLPSGTWSIPYPRCEAEPCPPPPVIANATASAEPGDNFTSGMSVTYSCDPGFSLVGNASLLCSPTGNWSLPYPRCAGVF